MAFSVLVDTTNTEGIMETRQEPAPRPQPAAKYPTQRNPLAESAKPGVTARVSVVDERHDEEEKEAGYGHGV
jgi:hypothetical protein